MRAGRGVAFAKRDGPPLPGGGAEAPRRNIGGRQGVLLHQALLVHGTGEGPACRAGRALLMAATTPVVVGGKERSGPPLTLKPPRLVSRTNRPKLALAAVVVAVDEGEKLYLVLIQGGWGRARDVPARCATERGRRIAPL